MKIAAFNVQNFGEKKLKDNELMKYIIEIISRYDVVVLVEVMDKSGKAMNLLLQNLNKTGDNRTRPFSMAASEPLGRSAYKEKFVCLYREDEVTLMDKYQYEDDQVGDEDAFAREPYCLFFQCHTTTVKKLVLVPVHTKPDDSMKEMEELDDVVESVREMWKTNNVMLLGDFNADGRYASTKKMRNMAICSAPYYWLIDDDADTTSRNSNDHTYDRIVVHGETLRKAVVPGSAQPFNFQDELDLSEETALQISDHYPVEVELKRAAEPRNGPQKKAAGNVRGQKTGASSFSRAPAKRRRVNN